MKFHLLKILPPVWLAIFVLSALGVDYMYPTSHVFDISGSLWASIIGTFVLLFGFGMTVHSSRLFVQDKTEILPTSPKNRALITRGSYRFTRNPMYLGMVLSILGVALWIGTLPMFIAALAQFLVLNYAFIPFEEEKMARQFGTTYENYKKRARRWL